MKNLSRFKVHNVYEIQIWLKLQHKKNRSIRAAQSFGKRIIAYSLPIFFQKARFRPPLHNRYADKRYFHSGLQ